MPIQTLLQPFFLCLVCLLAHTFAFAAPVDQCPTGSMLPPSLELPAKGDEELPLPFCRLSRDAYLVPGAIAQLDTHNRGLMGNAGFVVTSEGVVVIDALGTPRLGRRLIATIRSVTDQPVRYLIITHNHPDHSYGASAFRSIAGVKVIAHTGSRDYLDSATFAASVDYRRNLLKEDMAGFSAVIPDQLIDREPYTSQRITLGNKSFDIYNAGRHHSWGDLVVHQREDGIVWISDLAFNGRTTFMADGHSREVVNGIRWLEKTFATARLMVPGHGYPQYVPFPMLERTREYVGRLRQMMGEAVEAGIEMQEAVDKAELPDWRDVPLYKENHRANVQFIYQEMEQELF